MRTLVAYGREFSGPSPASQVAADERRVFIPGKNSVIARDAETGAPLWAAGLAGTVQAGPAVSWIDGAPAVVAASSSRISAWDPATGRPGRRQRPDGRVGTRAVVADHLRQRGG